MKAKVVEIGASFAGLEYFNFWGELAKAGLQLTTLRLEVIKEMKPVSSLVVPTVIYRDQWFACCTSRLIGLGQTTRPVTNSTG